MTLEEFHREEKYIREGLEKEYDLELWELRSEYALSNNPYKVGDIIEDSTDRIKIKWIEIVSNTDFENIPQCVYYGTFLDKNNEPEKTQKKRGLEQSRVRRKIEKED